MKPQRTRIGAYALITADHRILLCRLSAAVPRWVGHWTLPGGGVEFGEHPDRAVVREVEEETGLLVARPSVVAVDSITDFSGNEDRHSIRILYRVKLAGGQLRSETLGTTDACEWFLLTDLEALPTVDLVKTALAYL